MGERLLILLLIYSFLVLVPVLVLVTTALAGEITIASWKVPLAGVETYDHAAPSEDIFSPFQWRDAAQTLMNNKNDMTVVSVSAQKDPEFRVTFDRSQPGAVAFGAAHPDDANVVVISWKNMLVHIRPSN